MRLFLARVRRVVGADAVDDALRDAVPDAVAMRGVAHRRIDLRERAEPLVAIGRGQRQMVRRRLGGGDVLVLGEEMRSPPWW